MFRIEKRVWLFNIYIANTVYYMFNLTKQINTKKIRRK